MDGNAIPQEIRSFLEGLINDAGIMTLDDSEREELITELFARLDSFITATIIDSLPQDKVDEFIKMSESARPQAELQAYLNEHVPNSQEVFQNAFVQFRTMYLGNVNTSRQLHPSTTTQPKQPDSTTT